MRNNYILGAADATNAPLRLQFTCAGDGWASLAQAYLGKQDMASQRAIMLMQPFFKTNGVKSNAQVQNFIKALPGWNRDRDIFAFDAKNNPGTTGPNGPEGFAHFGVNTQLMLPDMPRLDGKTPGPGALVPVLPPIEEAGVPPIAILIGLAGLGLLLFGKKKKKGETPKPVF